MNGDILKAMLVNEVRLRMRRVSTIVMLLAVAVFCWMIVPDPASGYTMIAVHNARVLNTSSAMAIGTASMAGLIFGFGGFYLLRGRMAEDLRTGLGSVIGASPVSNGVFLFGRWLGGAAYLCVLMVMFMLTVWLCHLLRGDGPIQPFVYLETYLLLLLPMIVMSASCAVLFDSVGPLMGKRGDVVYFFLWAGQVSVMAAAASNKAVSWNTLILFDFTGLAAIVERLQTLLHTGSMSVGFSDFDKALAPITLPEHLWSLQDFALRGASCVMALLPLLLAIVVFHRYSADKVKAKQSVARRTPLAVLNDLLSPLRPLVSPLFALAAHVPGLPGQVIADLALSFATSPAMILGVALSFVAGLLCPMALLPEVLKWVAVGWGICIAEMSTRDFQADAEGLSGVGAGGTTRRYLRQLLAAVLLAALFMGPIALRQALHAPVLAAALATGVLGLAALAMLAGRLTRTPRTYLSVFMIASYVAVQTKGVPMLDPVGFSGAATPSSVLAWAAIALSAGVGGYLWNRHMAA